MDAQNAIAKLIDRWCERKALRPLAIVLPVWPPPNRFTDEWQEVWVAMRHVRAICRDDLAQNGEAEDVNAIVAALSQQLFPRQTPCDIEQTAERITAAMFGDRPR